MAHSGHASLSESCLTQVDAARDGAGMAHGMSADSCLRESPHEPRNFASRNSEAASQMGVSGSCGIKDSPTYHLDPLGVAGEGFAGLTPLLHFRAGPHRNRAGFFHPI